MQKNSAFKNISHEEILYVLQISLIVSEVLQNIYVKKKKKSAPREVYISIINHKKLDILFIFN